MLKELSTMIHVKDVKMYLADIKLLYKCYC